MSRPILILAVAALALLVPAPALAHLEIKPDHADPGVTRSITFHIENERSNASTVRLDVQLPPGVRGVRAVSLGGWKLKQSGAAGEARQISFIAGKPLGPGTATKSFKVSMTLPRTPGATISFKGVQTYDDGQKDRWIGPPGSDQPAPTLKLSTKPIAGATGALGATGKPSPTTAAKNGDDGGDGDSGISGGLIAVLVAAGVLAIAAGAWLLNRRNRRRS